MSCEFVSFPKVYFQLLQSATEGFKFQDSGIGYMAIDQQLFSITRTACHYDYFLCKTCRRVSPLFEFFFLNKGFKGYQFFSFILGH